MPQEKHTRYVETTRNHVRYFPAIFMMYPCLLSLFAPSLNCNLLYFLEGTLFFFLEQ